MPDRPSLVYDFRTRPLDEEVCDLRLLYEGMDLEDLARKFLTPAEWRTFQSDRRRARAIVRSARVADMDVLDDRIMPLNLVHRARDQRQEVLGRAYDDIIQKDPGALGRHSELMAYARALLKMERHGLKIDRARATVILKGDTAAHERRFLRSALDLSAETGFAHARWSPVGGRTGRVVHEGGLETMSIPHGQCREVVVSRHEGGLIFTFDYNAIDFRSIVAAIPELAREYDGCVDFHTRTREILGSVADGVDRTALKYLTYIHLYGGSLETVGQKTGLTLERAGQILTRLDEKLSQVTWFRNRIHQMGVKDGYVCLGDSGRRVSVDPDAHPGKVLGLYAQGYSSFIFEKAVVAVEEHLIGRSVPIFTVHDELVVDVHPREVDLVQEITMRLMERPWGDHRFAVKVRMGRTYADATR